MRTLMLCHDCFHWVAPADNLCLECGSNFDISETDPDNKFIDYVIGNFEKEIGQVQIHRGKFLSQGKLFTTKNGLLFTPLHRYENKPPFLVKKQTKKTLNFLLNPFSEGQSFSEQTVTNPEHKQSFIDPDNQEVFPKSPAEMLLSHPGVFFISYEAIQSVHKFFYRWKLERTYGGSLWIKPISERNQFYFDMQELNSRITFKSTINY